MRTAVTAFSCARSSVVTIRSSVCRAHRLELGLQLHEVDAGGFGPRPHQGILDDVQDVKRGAERARELPPVVERRLPTSH